MPQTVYYFGNKDVACDNAVFPVVNRLQNVFPEISFVFVKPNQDVPFVDEKKVIILDTISGIDDVTVISESDLDKLVLNKSLSVHDFDLGFQLLYLKKLGKLHEITIIGVPQNTSVDHERIQSIFKKLVAQDMQGS